MSGLSGGFGDGVGSIPMALTAQADRWRTSPSLSAFVSIGMRIVGGAWAVSHNGSLQGKGVVMRSGDLCARALRAYVAVCGRLLASALAGERRLRAVPHRGGGGTGAATGAGSRLGAAAGAARLSRRSRGPGAVQRTGGVLFRPHLPAFGVGARGSGGARRAVHSTPRGHLLGSVGGRVRARPDDLRPAPDTAALHGHDAGA